MCHLLKLDLNIEVTNSKARTPLFYAAEEGIDGVVAVLLSYGAQKDVDDRRGYKPLIVAACKNCHQVVKLLLEAGVDPFTHKTRESPGRYCGNAKSTLGDTTVEYACEFNHSETVKTMVPFLDSEGLWKGSILGSAIWCYRLRLHSAQKSRN